MLKISASFPGPSAVRKMAKMQPNEGQESSTTKKKWRLFRFDKIFSAKDVTFESPTLDFQAKPAKLEN